MDENRSTPPNRPDDPSSQSKSNRSTSRRVIVWTVILLSFAALFTVVLRQHTPETAVQTGRRAAMAGLVTVVPATAQKGDIGIYQEAIGTVTPVYTSSVTSQITGLVMAVHYREGQLVHKGDLLIEIDSRPIEAQLAQARGTLEKDTQLLAQARMDLARYRAAWARNAVAKQTLEDQEKIVLQYEGTVKADQGLVQYDQVQLAYCRITAPFTGRTGLRLVDPGNVVQANGTSPLVVITQEQPITVIFTIAEDALGSVQAPLRQGSSLKVDAYDRAAQNKIATGKLLSVDNQIDTTTGTIKLRAIFDNKDGALFPNQFVNTRLLVETLKGMTLIPTSAVQHNGQTAFVYVVQNGVAQMRTVRPGAADSGMTAVEGINPGEVVANSSFEKLQPNAKVQFPQGHKGAGSKGESMP
ncbi:MAG: efflux RND transporter periplasmic adaptor subunit [Acidobacteria bacterium]|nr:MAG: efflux RND transporter periplasmic adaptor subunit [Acidobacteriota bacterium]